MNKTLIIIILALISLIPLFSHPHMLVFTRCELVFEEEDLKGVWIELEFDSFFSGEIIWGYDEDGDGVFDKNETNNLYHGAFMSLKDYSYFTYFRMGEDRFSPQEVQSFSARSEGPELLFYKFFVPLDIPDRTDFHIAIYDYSLFCLVRYQDDFISVQETVSEDIVFTIEENKDFPVYYNPNGKANDKTLYKKWAPGLSTFIPKEIHVQF